MKQAIHCVLCACCLLLFVQCAAGPEPHSLFGRKPNPDEALQMLQEGNIRFSTGKTKHPEADAARFRLAGTENQRDHAIATVLSCSDSRVPVELIFDTGVMDLFVVRVAGNVCDTDEIGSIEYGLAHVHTPLFVMLGHTQCGAVTAVTHAALGKGHALERNIPPLLENIIPAVQRAMEIHKDARGEAVLPYAIEENVWQGIEDLLLKSPATFELVRSGKVKMAGAIYDVGTGVVSWLPPEKVDAIVAGVEANPFRETDPFGER